MSKNKRYDFSTRKSIHFHLNKNIHADLRIALLQKGVTMQDALEACSVLIAEQHPFMEKHLDKVVERKLTGEKQIAKREAESIYDAIERARRIEGENKTD